MYQHAPSLVWFCAITVLGLIIGIAVGLWHVAYDRYELWHDKQKVRRLLALLEERERGQNSEKDC